MPQKAVLVKGLEQTVVGRGGHAGGLADGGEHVGADGLHNVSNEWARSMSLKCMLSALKVPCSSSNMGPSSKMDFSSEPLISKGAAP
jgi:hypothetical protein